jgi:hypothetical protein
MKALESLAYRSGRLYQTFTNGKKKQIVSHKCHFPILFFGDSLKYSRSRCKIVTLDKNPSEKEFQLRSNKSRFPTDMNLLRTNGALYLDGLNGYFELRPYGWFHNYEFILNGLDASYYPRKRTDGRRPPNTALHTDLFSPLATAKPWSKLEGSKNKAERDMAEKMRKKGGRLWHRLIDRLQPDLMITCLKHDDLRKEIPSLRDRREHEIIASGRKYVVYSYGSDEGNQAVILQGIMRNVPFGGISERDLVRIGEYFKDICGKY